MSRYRIILHVFTSVREPPPSWEKVKGEPDGVYAIDDHQTYERLDFAKKRARWRVDEVPYFPPLCYVMRSYVWDTESEVGESVKFSYHRGNAIEKEGPY